MTKLLAPNLRTQLKAIYRNNQILWAVIRGYDTPQTLLGHFNCHPDKLQDHLNVALKKELVYYRGNRLLPTKNEHKQMKDLVKRAEVRKMKRQQG